MFDYHILYVPTSPLQVRVIREGFEVFFIRTKSVLMVALPCTILIWTVPF